MNKLCILNPNSDFVSDYRIVYYNDDIDEYDFSNITTIIAEKTDEIDKYILKNFDVIKKINLKKYPIIKLKQYRNK